MQYDIKRLQKIELEIFDEFKRVCDKNNIRYYLAYGSCLGAVRHKGFIPWDDDIDVFMYFDDILKLFQHSNEFDRKFFLQSYFNDKDFINAIVRLRKNGTALVEKDDINLKCNHGIYIDIYPLYYLPNNIFLRSISTIKSILLRVLLAKRGPINHGKFFALIGKIIFMCFNSENKRKEVINKIIISLTTIKNTKYVSTLYGDDSKLFRNIMFKSSSYREPSKGIFEGRVVNLPTNYDDHLSREYGFDYMKIPSIEKQKSWHNFEIVYFDKEYNI